MVRFASYTTAVLVIASLVTAQAAPQAASVEKLEVQKAESGIYFRVSITWPSEAVPEEYSKFVESKETSRWSGSFWPHDALALVPQSPGAYRICREASPRTQENANQFGSSPVPTVESPALFVGRIREADKQEFLLRCPKAGGTWHYLPISIDFGQAKPGDDLVKAWLRAQATDLSAASSGDNSFYAYARARLLARLGTAATAESFDPGVPRPEASEHLYEITTGALALQESLQLDRMRSGAIDAGSREVSIETIKGVTVRAHPWKEMIGAKQPKIEAIAALVPEDQYYVRFTTTRALSEFLEFADDWGGSLLAMAETAGRDYGVKEKIETQICLRTSWLSKLLGPAVIESLVVTGSDPYLREGSDLTIIFQLKAAPIFEAAVARYLDEARKQHPDLTEGQDVYEGTSIQHLITPDKAVRCYRAKLGDYFLYSNSPVAIRRSIDAHKGKGTSIAQSLDFAYIRTLYPLGAEEEDGFIFLSDPFIRALVGPRIRIAEKRRLEAITSMELVKNAALLHLWEHPGAKVATLEQLYDQGYLEPKYLHTEPGDRISWNPATFTATSERYGRMGALTPIIELPVDKVTKREETEYNAFRDRYQNYWRRYFDPIGIRVSTGRDIGLSVTILPLIDNSEYDQMQRVFGGKTVDLIPPKAASSAVFFFTAHLNPENPDLKSLQRHSLTMLPGAPEAAVEWIGERLLFWVGDSEALPVALREESFGAIFRIPIVFGVEVKNPFGLTAFLVAAQTMIRASAPDMLIFELTEPYKGRSFTRVRPSSRDEEGFLKEFADAALYYGSVGRFFYISTSLELLQRIVDGAPSTAPATGAAPADPPAPATQPARKGHFALRVALADAKHSKAAAEFFVGRAAQAAETTHHRNLLLLARTVGLGDKATASQQRVLGYSIESALGSTYRYDAAHDEIVGSATGSQWAPPQPPTIPDDSPLGRLMSSIRSLNAQLAFTEDGLRSDLQIERK